MKPKVRVMVPVAIAPSMLGAATSIPEPNTANGEVAWVSAGTYVAGDERTSNGAVWICRVNNSARTQLPENDPTYWLRLGSTDRMAPFDDYTSTTAQSTGALTFVINPGFINSIRVYKAVGDSCKITVKDSPGGTIVEEKTFDLFAQAAGFYELLYTVLPSVEQVGIDDLPILPGVEVTITITSALSGRVAVGDIKLGDWRSLTGDGDWGGTEVGAVSERKSYTFREYAKDGTYTQVKRPSSRDVRCSIKMPGDQAAYVDAVLGEITDIAVPFEASNLPRYGYLNSMGFVTGSLGPDSYGSATLSLTIKGNI